MSPGLHVLSAWVAIPPADAFIGTEDFANIERLARSEN
jgi:hypothetical protein